MTDLPADLTATELTTFRNTWIRDAWDGSDGLSEYNRSRATKFFSDASLQQIYDDVLVDYADHLVAIWETHNDERIEAGDDVAEAEASADALRIMAVYKLMRINCRSQMANDPGFRASVTVGEKGPEAIFKQWRTEQADDFAWIESRAGWLGGSTVERA